MSVFEKLAKIQKELKVPKNQYNSFGKYKYRSCEDILESAKPVAIKHGCVLHVIDKVINGEKENYIQACPILTDLETGEQIKGSGFAREETSKKGMDASQITGKASSYARKYALNGLFCIDDTKDADTEENIKERQARENKKKDDKKTEDIGNMKIAEIKQKTLLTSFDKNKIDIFKVLELYKVKDIKDITEKQYSNIVKNIDKLSEKCGADNES